MRGFKKQLYFVLFIGMLRKKCLNSQEALELLDNRSSGNSDAATEDSSDEEDPVYALLQLFQIMKTMIR